VVGVTLLALYACAKIPPPDMTPETLLRVPTADGWQVAVRHYPGAGPPVLLVHGMGVNTYNWDYAEEVSFAAWLRTRGWDVWVPALRGDPDSVAPSRAARDYSFDDHAVLDLPPIVDAVLEATGASRLSWVGHSMGGLLLYTALAQYPEKIGAGVAICSPGAFFDLGPLHRAVRDNGWAVRGRGRLPVTTGWFLTGWLGRASPVATILGNTENMAWPISRGVAGKGLVNVPNAMARQVVGWLTGGVFTRVDGTPWIRDADVPLLVLGAKDDRIAPWPWVKAACDQYSRCEWRLLGKDAGYGVDYGHVDPVVGISAPTEVYPVLEGFLAAHAKDAP
jgi:pimeloyl-ACP methyl ester carboxylesterase